MQCSGLAEHLSVRIMGDPERIWRGCMEDLKRFGDPLGIFRELGRISEFLGISGAFRKDLGSIQEFSREEFWRQEFAREEFSRGSRTQGKPRTRPLRAT